MAISLPLILAGLTLGLITSVVSRVFNSTGTITLACYVLSSVLFFSGAALGALNV